MKGFVCCLILLVSYLESFSQKEYFIYIQSETENSFFVQINEKTYSSTSSGYLILSRLKDSSYSFKIGFPQNKWPEQQFSIEIKSEDRGFLLKNFDEKGWGLFDLQTMAVQMSVESGEKDKAGKKEMKEVSAFTDILSKAANDPSLREKSIALVKYDEKPPVAQHIVVTEPIGIANEQAPGNINRLNEEGTKKNDSSFAVKKESVKNADTTKIAEQQKKAGEPIVKAAEESKKKTDSLAIVKQTVDKKEEPPAAAKNEKNSKATDAKVDSAVNYKRSLVTKKSESSTTEGLGLTFVDQYADGQKDTIRIVIPNPSTQFVKENEQPADERKFLDITEQSKESEFPAAKSIAKKDCSSIASENDFLRLRKKMAGLKTEEAMINEAKKGFKPKCFTNEQIKNLGNLFLNEAGKFQFYEAAYPYSSDRDNFTVLQTELKENYFIHRFKNLVKTSSL